MKQSLLSHLSLFVFLLVTCSVSAQEAEKHANESTSQLDFSDRQAILKTIESFYIGDHTGSIKHKKRSMHEKGAYNLSSI
ncbi:MAG: hypothetical protein AAF551_11715, partial [Bacteroidota bacterium]